MLIAVIIGFGPILVIAYVTFLAMLPGLVWSPFAALITWRMAQRRGLDGRWYALVGALCSVFLLLPWILLTVALLRRHLPVSVIKLSYILLYAVWLVGPIVIWGQHVARIDFLTSLWLFEGVYSSEPAPPIYTYGVYMVMVLMWIVSGVMSLKIWNFEYDVTYQVLMSFRYITPFALTWACILLLYVYLLFNRELFTG